MMEMDEIKGQFSGLVWEFCEDRFNKPGYPILSFIAQEQMRAGFFQEAEQTLGRALVELFQIPEHGTDYGGFVSICETCDSFKFYTLAIGYAKAGKTEEAMESANQIPSEEYREAALALIGSKKELSPEEDASRHIAILLKIAGIHAPLTSFSARYLEKASEIADRALSLKSRKEGDNLPADFAKKPMPGPQGGDKNKKPSGTPL